MKICLTLACLVATCLAATTTRHPHSHGPHPTHEPNEGDGFQFVYNGKSHDLVVKHRSGKVYICYIATVTDDERNLVHSDAGLRSLELRVLGLLSSATVVDMSSIDPVNLKYCGHAPHNGTMIYKTIS